MPRAWADLRTCAIGKSDVLVLWIFMSGEPLAEMICVDVLARAKMSAV